MFFDVKFYYSFFVVKKKHTFAAFAFQQNKQGNIQTTKLQSHNKTNCFDYKNANNIK